MIRIAVVDDDWYISSRIERILLSYDHISTYDLDIEVFQNGLDYFKYLKNEHDFDLIFLDMIDCQVKCNTIREKNFEAPRRESEN